MKKITLKIKEVYELFNELKGLKDPQTGQLISKGLLEEKLLISVKYSLDNLADTLLAEIKKIEDLKQEAIKRLGKEDENGGIFLPMRVDEVFDEEGKLISANVNPSFIEYQKEIDELLNNECVIEYREVTLDQLNIETEVNPHILFKLITSDES